MISAAALTALIAGLTEIPQLINGGEELAGAILTLFKANVVALTPDQVAAMNAAVASAAAGQTADQAAAGPKPT